jgi:hypothetical protein
MPPPTTVAAPERGGGFEFDIGLKSRRARGSRWS